MGNKKSREFMKKQADEKAWEYVENNSRNLYDFVFIPRIGMPRLQILYSPPFKDSKWWEVRQLESEWHLYGSKVSFEGGPFTLKGYKRIPSKSEILHDFFNRACKLNLSIKPYLDDFSFLDDTIIEISIIGDLVSLIRFRFSYSCCPDHWSEMLELAKQMITKFQSLE